MDDSRTTLALLAHFDHPKTFALQAAEPDDVGSSAIKQGANQSVPAGQITKLCIRWVLKWATAMGMLMLAAMILTEFAYMVAAEHRLNSAARAAVSEAMLPRATVESVRAAVERRIGDRRLLFHLQLTILQNGQPAQRQIRQSEGDRFAVSVSLPSSDVVPGWTRLLNPSHRESLLYAHAERQVPSRKLAYREPGQTAAE